MRTITRAILRKPGPNFSEGQTEAGGNPDFDIAIAQHKAYLWELFALGVDPDLLDHDPEFPDGCFVEDTAIVTEHGAIITNPGHPSRIGETKAIAEILGQEMPLRRIEGPGTLDGGDVIRAEDHFYIGLSGRTNEAGASQLSAHLADFGFSASNVPVEGALHLKSLASYVGGGNVVVAGGFPSKSVFPDFKCIETLPEEAYAANILALNGTLIIAAGYLRLAEELHKQGFSIRQLEMSEFRKMDGSLTCLSLLW